MKKEGNKRKKEKCDNLSDNKKEMKKEDNKRKNEKRDNLGDNEK